MRKFIIALLLLVAAGSATAETPEKMPVYKVDFYQSGEAKFEALLADMMQAKEYLHVEYFIFANDQIADRMLQVMRRKVREGVKVRLIIDGYYDVEREYNYHKHLGMMRGDGLDVYLYNPYVFPYVNHNRRDHRKIVVIDGKVGYTGGFNVADYNIQGKPGIYGSYIDTHVRLEGEAVRDLNALFLEHFNRLSGEALSPQTFELSEPSEPSELSEPSHPSPLNPHPSSAKIVSRSSKDGRRREMRKAVIEFINAAQRDLYIQSPYLLPTPGIRHALRKAQKRGVKIHIMFSEKGDTPLFDIANLTYARKLQRKGADVWLYQNAFLHSKVLTADGRCSMVGSMNLDYRAMRWNEEVAAVIYDEEAAAWLDNAFFDAMDQCKVMDERFYKNLPRTTRISGHLIDYFLGWCL